MSPGDTTASTEDVLEVEFILRLYVGSSFFSFLSEKLQEAHLKTPLLCFLFGFLPTIKGTS